MAVFDPDDPDWITDDAVRDYVGQQRLDEILGLPDLDGYRAAANLWLIETIDAHIAAQGIYPSTATRATELDRDAFLEAGALDLFLRAKGGSDSVGDLSEYLGEFRERRRIAWERGLRVALI